MINIVLVDDEERILRGLSLIIKRLGEQYDVVGSFENAANALEFVKHNSIDVLISDIKMPEMDGLTLVKEVKKVQPEIHCVMLSGYNDYEFVRTAFVNGAIDYLLKPVDDDELKKILSRVVARRLVKPDDSAYLIKSGFSKETDYIKTEIETNYSAFDMDSCAESLGKTKEYLSKIFKKETGKNIKDYLRIVRVTRAKELLEDVNGFKVYEVGNMVGFEDTVYFTKVFKEIAGMTPKDYQQKSIKPNRH